ncbi:MAG: hypothetical protein JXR03_14935 [Cyclobacteriaceae bacterium]
MKVITTKRIIYLLLSFIFVTSISCNPRLTKFSLIYSTDEPIGEITKQLKSVLEKSFHNVEIELHIGQGSEANLDSVASGKIDFTIVENHVPYKEGVNSILVFYPQILHIFHSKSYQPQSFQELVLDRKIFIGEPGSGSYRFMTDMIDFYGIDKSRVEITILPFDNYDVYAGFSDVLTPDDLFGLGAFTLFSFDDASNVGNGSIIDGIALKYPKVSPYVIPRGTYGDFTSKPVVTISSNAILVCRSGLWETTVNDMIKTIFKEKQTFSRISPLIASGLDEGFDRANLDFPLHEGARTYLDRDEPDFFERYAELFGVAFSIVIAIASGLISLSKWQKQKKKDRIDVFYKTLMEIKKELPKVHSSHEAFLKIKEIKDLQDKAFEMLINEELIADESFRIFTELSAETIDEVKQRARVLKTRESKAS